MVFFAEENWRVSRTCAAGKFLRASAFSMIQMARSSSATKTARRGFHSGWPTEAPPRQHFCTQSAPPGFVCWEPQPSSLIQPVRGAFFCCADSEPSARRPQINEKARTVRRLIIFSSSRAPQRAFRLVQSLLRIIPPSRGGVNCLTSGSEGRRRETRKQKLETGRAKRKQITRCARNDRRGARRDPN